jgi:hypothetical protein
MRLFYWTSLFSTFTKLHSSIEHKLFYSNCIVLSQVTCEICLIVDDLCLAERSVSDLPLVTKGVLLYLNW